MYYDHWKKIIFWLEKLKKDMEKKRPNSSFQGHNWKSLLTNDKQGFLNHENLILSSSQDKKEKQHVLFFFSFSSLGVRWHDLANWTFIRVVTTAIMPSSRKIFRGQRWNETKKKNPNQIYMLNRFNLEFC